MKLVVFTSLLSVLLISSSVYLFMDQKKSELMNLHANSENDTCLDLQYHYSGPMRYERVTVFAKNLCQTSKKFTVVYLQGYYGEIRIEMTECLTQNQDHSTSMGENFTVYSITEFDC